MPDFVVDQPKVVICEGKSDASFLRALLTHRGALNGVSVCSIDGITKGTFRGKDNFGGALRAIRTSAPKVRHVVVVADADDDAAAAFAAVQRQIRDLRATPGPATELKFAVPDTAGVLKHGEIAVAVLTLPLGAASGCLDDALYPVASAAHPANAAAIDALVAATAVHTWPPRAQVKSRLRCLMSTSHSAQPDIALGNVWTDTRGGGALIPISDPAFDATAAAVRALLA